MQQAMGNTSINPQIRHRKRNKIRVRISLLTPKIELHKFAFEITPTQKVLTIH